MPHRPLFVLRCHHFSPVIYFIAISVSLPPSPSSSPSPSPPPPPPPLQCLSSFFTCALSLPPLGRSFLLSPAPSHLTPPRTVPTNTSLETLHYTTQHNSTLLTLPETLLYVSVSVSFSLLPVLSRARAAASFSLSLALPRTGGISTTMPSARKKERGGRGGGERGRYAR